MPARIKPYEQFGPYLLFKKLETDAVSELWRAARIDDGTLGPAVALRRFNGAGREQFADAAAAAAPVISQLSGTSFVRSQTAGVVDGTGFVAHEYSGGRTLRHVIDRARAGRGIPADLALAIAERIALSLATTAELRIGGSRLAHGAAVPGAVWIADDGEVRVGGQQLGAGYAAALRDEKAAAELRRYFAPEIHHSGIPSPASEVFSLGALLYLVLTGNQPPDATTASAFAQAVQAAELSGAPIPAEIRAVLDRSLVIDPARRYPSVAEMKQALSALVHDGQYTGTTFNLAFFVSTLLKKELESEALDREKEAKVSLAAYLEPEQEPLHVDPPVPAAPMFASAVPEKKRSALPLVAAIVLLAIGAGAFVVFRSRTTAPQPKPRKVAAAQVVTPARPQLVSQPLVAAPAPPAGAAAAGAAPVIDEAARQKAFEAAVEQKLQQEMMKLQRDYTRSLQQQQSAQAPLPSPTPQHAAEDNAPSAAALDQQRLTSTRQEAAATPPAPQQQPVTTPAAPAPQPAAAAAPAAPVVREGDVIDVQDLDAIPHVTRPAAPVYPMIAMRQRIEATILVTALISETGEVLDARVLRGDSRFGFQEAALRAVRATRFSAPVKDGKRVKTWFPIPVSFKL